MAMQKSSATPEQTNFMMRRLLRQSAPLIKKNLGVYSGAGGGNIRVKLNNTGLITRLLLKVSFPVTIGTATASVGPRSAYALLNKIRVVDYDGSDRVNVPGWLLWMRNCLRNPIDSLHGAANVPSASGGSTATAFGITSPLTNPSISTSVGSATNTFFIEVPICADIRQGDLRGMLFAQTTVGELYLSIDIASTLYGNANDNFVFNGGATSTAAFNGNVTVEVIQEYYLPQQVEGILPIPQIDTLTVYELTGLSSNSDFAANTDKYLSMPNVRQVTGIYLNYLNNSISGGSAGNDLNYVRIVANGNNILYDMKADFQYFEQRSRLGSDMSKGMYFFDLEQSPIQTALYGNVQTVLNPGGSLTSPTVDVAYESFYIKGAALSGLSQAG